jgi:hypothetical protein
MAIGQHDHPTRGGADLRSGVVAGTMVAIGLAGAAAYLSGQESPANRAVLDAAGASGSLSVRLGQTGSPLPVLVAYFWSVWGLAALAAVAALLGAWAVWRLTDGLCGRGAELWRAVIVAGAAAGLVAVAMLDVRTALMVALAMSAWRHLQDFALRGMVQSGFYGGLLLAAAAAVEPTAAFWAIALAAACFLLPGRSRSFPERAAGALVVAFPGVAITCLWALMRLVLAGTWQLDLPTPHLAALVAAAYAGIMLWLSLDSTDRSGVGAATIPVLLAGSAGVLGPALVTVAIPVMAGLSVITLVLAARWATIRTALVGLAASVAMLGAVSAALGGTSSLPRASAVPTHGAPRVAGKHVDSEGLAQRVHPQSHRHAVGAGSRSDGRARP